MQQLVDLVYAPRTDWERLARSAFSYVLRERYPRVADLSDKRNDEKRFQLRVNADTKDGAIPYAALIGPDQEYSGAYGGMSLVMFPADAGSNSPALIGMVVGTNGLAPDEGILSRPGHARKCGAVSAWQNAKRLGQAWAKRDPTRIDLDLPKYLDSAFEPWAQAMKKYGKVMYAAFMPPPIRSSQADVSVAEVITAFLDIFFEERRILPIKKYQAEGLALQRQWMSCIMPATTSAEVAVLLQARKYVIIEGPPGTGKTEMARSMMATYGPGQFQIIQFHPSTTYESFVGGLAPRDGGQLGFTFKPVAGHLMQAAQRAKDSGKPFLLVIDEINRADLAKVLGEAIHLFEPGKDDREITLPYDFPGHGRTLRLPKDLHVLGTMNSADRSIAILDLAVRRRFAFVPLWPQFAVVEANAGPVLIQRFHEILSLFVEHASDDALALTPGHAYFLGTDAEAGMRMVTGLKPLLEEYLAQGYVAGFADEVRSFLSRTMQAD